MLAMSADAAEQPQESQPVSETISADNASPVAAAPAAPRIKIGSQREGSYVPPPPTPVIAMTPAAPATAAAPTSAAAPVEAAAPAAETPAAEPAGSAPAEAAAEESQPRRGKQRRGPVMPEAPVRNVERPNIRAELSPELQDELDAALAGVSLDELVEKTPAAATADVILPESRQQGRVVGIHGDDLFVDLGGRNQAVVSASQFPEPPAIGAAIEIVISQFDAEEGLFRARVPGHAIDVADWSEVAEGLVVEARITAANKGGLECEVNALRGFIPASQISLYRVEDLTQFVGQRLTCVVTEANPQKRNLVLSHRAVLEREQADARKQILAELAPGQVREGIVRSLRDFGAFVDLGGVDGLIHISQLSWARVKHPSEVLTEGQKVQVKVLKIDPQTHKIGLGLRELTESPWSKAATKFPALSIADGKVTRLAEFGAFVQLEPGVEGLVHISELSHKRVFRVSDILSEGQEVQVKILSIDPENQRMSLSLKALEAKPQAAKAEPEPEDEPVARPVKKNQAPLKGGIGSAKGGERFGLRW
jgi:small subunit ribosomal protein S1